MTDQNNVTPNDAPEDAVAAVEETQPMDQQPLEESDDRMKELQAEAEKNLQGWQRTLAEFQNYKRRVEREQQDLKLKIALETIKKMLPIIDDFERAQANIPDDLKDHPWINGVALIQGKFKKLMDEYDIQPIAPDGEAFDPNIHEAISMDASDDVESGHVIETVLKGYISGDIVLRPAMVRVAN